MQLPAELREKIESLLSSDDRKTLSAAADSVSKKYRRETTTDLQIASADEAKAYLAARFPATWCAVANVLQRLLDIYADFAPATVLDLGAGPGTASLAAQHFWPDIEPTLIEPNTELRKIGQQLLNADWKAQTIQQASIDTKFDLVIASYVFNEISSDIQGTLEPFWEKTAGALILIEPGTPHGYQTILKARDYFLKLGANIAAPCPHHFTCPLANSDCWCHFSVRVDRSRLHRQIKPDAQLSYEDEKFSYLVVTKNITKKPIFRALGEPHGQKVISLETCQSNGAFEIIQVSKRDDNYKTIKKMDWGASLDAGE